jgi:hypothetical protein
MAQPDFDHTFHIHTTTICSLKHTPRPGTTWKQAHFNEAAEELLYSLKDYGLVVERRAPIEGIAQLHGNAPYIITGDKTGVIGAIGITRDVDAFPYAGVVQMGYFRLERPPVPDFVRGAQALERALIEHQFHYLDIQNGGRIVGLVPNQIIPRFILEAAGMPIPLLMPPRDV